VLPQFEELVTCALEARRGARPRIKRPVREDDICGLPCTRDAHEHVVCFLRPTRGGERLRRVRLEEGAKRLALAPRLPCLSALPAHEEDIFAG